LLHLSLTFVNFVFFLLITGFFVCFLLLGFHGLSCWALIRSLTVCFCGFLLWGLVVFYRLEKWYRERRDNWVWEIRWESRDLVKERTWIWRSMESFLPRLFWSAQQEFQLVLLIQVMVIKLDFVFFCSFFFPRFSFSCLDYEKMSDTKIKWSF